MLQGFALRCVLALLCERNVLSRHDALQCNIKRDARLVMAWTCLKDWKRERERSRAFIGWGLKLLCPPALYAISCFFGVRDLAHSIQSEVMWVHLLDRNWNCLPWDCCLFPLPTNYKCGLDHKRLSWTVLAGTFFLQLASYLIQWSIPVIVCMVVVHLLILPLLQ